MNISMNCHSSIKNVYCFILSSPSCGADDFISYRSTSLCLQRWRPWWIQARWESRSQAFPRGVCSSTLQWPSPPVKDKTSLMCPQLCSPPYWIAPNIQWIKTTQAHMVCPLYNLLLTLSERQRHWLENWRNTKMEFFCGNCRIQHFWILPHIRAL